MSSITEVTDPHFIEIPTGDTIEPTSHKILIYPFERYEISIKVGPNNEFLGIVEVKVNNQFMSYFRSNGNCGYHDVSDSYLDEKPEK